MGQFPEDYIPTIWDNHSERKIIDGRLIDFSLWDTAGQEDYSRLRPLSYPNTDIFLICFSVNSRYSFDNVRDQWVPELQHHSPGTPFILCGLKCDLRTTETTESDIVSISLANTMQREIGALSYIEVSAKNGMNVEDCIE